MEGIIRLQKTSLVFINPMVERGGVDYVRFHLPFANMLGCSNRTYF